MVLPLYLAMSALELQPIPHGAFLVLDHTEVPPPGILPVITDHFPLDGQVLDRICQGREAVVLDFEQPPTSERRAMLRGLPCPCAAPPGYCDDGPVFLPPAPLRTPLEVYLAPFQGREIWLEAALQQQTITVTARGTTITPPSPSRGLTGGFYEKHLRCRFTQDFSRDRAVFTLFDTPETLREKLAHAAALGVTRAIGLYGELGGKPAEAY